MVAVLRIFRSEGRKQETGMATVYVHPNHNSFSAWNDIHAVVEATDLPHFDNDDCFCAPVGLCERIFSAGYYYHLVNSGSRISGCVAINISQMENR
jgi:hypothetical protein